MEKKTLAISSLFLAFTFCFFAPVEMYLVNKKEFWFSTKSFILIPIVLTMISWIILYGIGMLLDKKWRMVWSSFIFALGFMIYFQGSFLNKAIGLMNGMEVNWKLYRSPFLLNWFVWITGIVGIIILCSYVINRFPKMILYTATFFFLIQFVTISFLLVVDMIESPRDKGKYLSMKNVYTVSEDENIIVFILDMFDDRYFDELVVEDPNVENIFDGFTQFTNCTGVYAMTYYSVGHFLTGEYLLNQKGNLSDDINYMYENSQLFQNLKEAGYDLNIYTSEYCIPKKLQDNLSNYCDGKIRISNYLDFTSNLYQLAACKYLPNFVKQYCWLIGDEFDDLRLVDGEFQEQTYSNTDFYEKLLEKGLNTKKEKEFKFIHINGTHYPYVMDENVVIRDSGKVTVKQTAKGCIKIVEEYFNQMKKCGIYDSSNIIIMADHGFYKRGTITNPLLLVKPRESKGRLKYSDACVSQKDFQPSIYSMAGLNDNLEHGYGFLDVPEGMKRDRYFYQFIIRGKNKENRDSHRLVEYKIDPENNDRSGFHVTGVEYNLKGEKVDHFKLCSLCRSGKGEADSPETVINHE